MTSRHPLRALAAALIVLVGPAAAQDPATRGSSAGAAPGDQAVAAPARRTRSAHSATRPIAPARPPQASLAPAPVHRAARTPTRYVPPPPPAPEEPLRPAASSRGLVLELRNDFGFDRLITVTYANGSHDTIRLDDGFAGAIGVSFLPLAGGRFGSRASVGFKLSAIRGSNGSAWYTMIPLDLVEVAYVGPFRFGAGFSLLIAPRLSGTGFLNERDLRFDPAPGALGEAEWIFAPRTRTGVGVRFAVHRFSATGVDRTAASAGLVLRTDFDLARHAQR